MNISVFLGIVVFVACFGGVLYLNSSAGEGTKLFFVTPPYNYAVGDALSYVNAFLFVFILSAAFFGIAAPLALGIEGLKYASLLSTGIMPVYDILFAIPQVFAAYSAALLGRGAIEDYQGKGSVFAHWKDSVKFFVVGAVSLVILIAVRSYL
ncbi:MAG TPA: hypothetical protein VI875_00535 [Candidatus Norongarragalinales archaeon]|nr:hypothetical protein [Candidatus Norongarragalinales archaeon]